MLKHKLFTGHGTDTLPVVPDQGNGKVLWEWGADVMIHLQRQSKHLK